MCNLVLNISKKKYLAYTSKDVGDKQFGKRIGQSDRLSVTKWPWTTRHKDDPVRHGPKDTDK